MQVKNLLQQEIMFLKIIDGKSSHAAHFSKLRVLTKVIDTIIEID